MWARSELPARSPHPAYISHGVGGLVERAGVQRQRCDIHQQLQRLNKAGVFLMGVPSFSSSLDWWPGSGGSPGRCPSHYSTTLPKAARQRI